LQQLGRGLGGYANNGQKRAPSAGTGRRLIAVRTRIAAKRA